MRRLDSKSASRCQPVVTIFTILLTIVIVHANSGRQERDIRSRILGIQNKVSHVLLEEIAFLQSHPEYDYDLPVIVRFSPDFDVGSVSMDKESNDFTRLESINGLAVRFLGRRLLDLAESDSIEFIAIDSPIYPTGDLPGGNGYLHRNIF